MAKKTDYHPGSTVLIQATVVDPDGNNTNASSAFVTIKNPHGRVIINNQSMTNTSTGVYEYAHVLSSTAVKGVWRATTTITTSDRPEVDEIVFTVS